MIIEKNGVKYFVFENLTKAGVKHCFTTRVGGVSEGAYSSLNLGFHNGDCPEAVGENLRRICDVVGFDVDSFVMTRQVHGVLVENLGLPGTIPEGGGQSPCDGLMTALTSVTLATYYADCVPIMLFDPVRRVIANAHAGWRGCAADMAGAAVAAMQRHYGCNPADILAGIGPAISMENFEVGQEVVDEFQKSLSFFDSFVYNSKVTKNKYHIDLWGICQKSLEQAGLKTHNIEVAGMCTYALHELFYSHRRDGVPRGNMLAMISL